MCEQPGCLGDRAGEEVQGVTSTHHTEDAEEVEGRIGHCEPLCFPESWEKEKAGTINKAGVERTHCAEKCGLYLADRKKRSIC